jgi:hypothetical protein
MPGLGDGIGDGRRHLGKSPPLAGNERGEEREIRRCTEDPLVPSSSPPRRQLSCAREGARLRGHDRPLSDKPSTRQNCGIRIKTPIAANGNTLYTAQRRESLK